MKIISNRLLYQFAFWFFALALYYFLRTFGKNSFVETSFLYWPFFLSILAILAALFFSFLDYFLQKLRKTNVRFGHLILRSTIVYSLTSILLFVISALIILMLYGVERSEHTLYQLVFSKEHLTFIVYTTIAGVIGSFIQEINKKLGPGNLMKFIKGKFYSPTEEERIFMFLDLKSSTKAAEILGHRNYSLMIQECFRDISIIDKYDGKFYQFVGDEAVITWDKVCEENVSKAVHAFFHYKQILESKGDLYLGKYGIKPVFKGSIHGGKVMVAEIGEIKREIAYHGDPINTTARMQSVCNELGEILLVSEFIPAIDHMLAHEFLISQKHIVQLKGKNHRTTLFGVRELSDDAVH